MPSRALTQPARRSRSPRATLALSTALLLALAASLLSVAGSIAAGATGRPDARSSLSVPHGTSAAGAQATPARPPAGR
jgi:hypothetical protein